MTYPDGRRSIPTTKSAARCGPWDSGSWPTDLERSENWAQVLSGGEQQRLAFGRALLNKPDWLFLDEATSALPEADQASLLVLKKQLVDTTLISIGHRESLVQFHDKQLVWQEKHLAFV